MTKEEREIAYYSRLSESLAAEFVELVKNRDCLILQGVKPKVIDKRLENKARKLRDALCGALGEELSYESEENLTEESEPVIEIQEKDLAVTTQIDL